MRAFFRWPYLPIVAWPVGFIGVYLVAEQIFGPYRHWTLWVRGPIATVVTAGFLWIFVGRHISGRTISQL